jgi:hypothetical protein
MSFSIPTLRSMMGKISTGSSYNYSTFCNIWNSDIPVYLNGSGYNYGAGIPTLSGPVTVSLANDPDLTQFFIDNPGSVINYSYTSVCSDPPNNPTSGNGSLVAGGQFVASYCTRGEQSDVTVTLTLSGIAPNWWSNTCCTPYAYCGHNGATVITSTVNFSMT